MHGLSACVCLLDVTLSPTKKRMKTDQGSFWSTDYRIGSTNHVLSGGPDSIGEGQF